jgi:hypothetical protein
MNAPCPKCGVSSAVVDTLLGGWLTVKCMGCGRQKRPPVSGAEGRDAGIASVSRNPTMATWRSLARIELHRLAMSGAEFSADDLTAVVGIPSEPNAVGAIFATAHKQGLIRPVGSRLGDNPQRHAGHQRTWRGMKEGNP